jgi:hypothetical protein
MVKNRFYTHVKHLMMTEEKIEIHEASPEPFAALPGKLDTIPSLREDFESLRNQEVEFGASLNNNENNQFMGIICTGITGSCDSNRPNRYLIGLTQKKGLGNGSFEEPGMHRPNARRDPFGIDMSSCVSMPMPVFETGPQFEQSQEEMRQLTIGFMSLNA